MIRLGLSKEGSFGVYKKLGLGKIAPDGLIELIAGKPYYDLNKFIDCFSFIGLPIKPFDYEKVKNNPSLANDFHPQLDYGKYGIKLLLFILKFVLLLPYFMYKMTLLAYTIYKLIKHCHITFYKQVLPAYFDYIEETNSRELHNFSEKELVDQIERIMQNWACVTLKDHIYSEICLEPVCKLLSILVGNQKTSILLSGIDGNKVTESNLQLWKLAVQACPRVIDVILNHPPEQIAAKLQGSENGRNYLEIFQQFLLKYGHRTSDEFELSTPRWLEEPARVFELIQHFLLSKKSNPLEHFEKQKRTRIELEEEQLKEYSAGIYKLIPMERKVYTFALKYSQIYSALRETTKFYHLMEYAQLRRYLVELGKRLSQRENSGVEEKDDIFYLLFKEIRSIVRNRLSDVRISQVISKRKRDYKTNLSIQLPPVIFYDSLDKLEAPVDIIVSDALTGTPVSGGRVKGKVRIISNPSEFGKFREGEILVASRTDVGWTPLFFTATALVMDTGNVLSHGAVIAREYGLPAVVNVKDACKILKNGQEVVVDGEEGKVYTS
ncbi:hypothetical protein JW935_14130 [candidate division KSB1 bacterium]|nr:hypothetical protein [candidate division KSB1 bacterium]